MEWTECLKRSILFMEQHLLDKIGPQEVAAAVNISPFYLQKGFKIMTGYSIGEYIRRRRLYMAALDILAGKKKIIDLAYQYGYDTPESFTKAFSRFHGLPPAQIKGDAKKIRTFLPLKIIVSIQGGHEMDYSVEKMEAFTVVGYEKEISFENSYQEIPAFWDEFCSDCSKGKISPDVLNGCGIGEYGICIDDTPGTQKFRYMIAGKYTGETVPEGMKLLQVPASEWVKFRCIGPLPGSLQAVNTRIFKEWLPGNPTFEFALGLNIEWYSCGDTSSPDYESAIWIPVKKK